MEDSTKVALPANCIALVHRTAPAALKSIHKLKSFMNLDYGIAVDELVSQSMRPNPSGCRIWFTRP